MHSNARTLLCSWYPIIKGGNLCLSVLQLSLQEFVRCQVWSRFDERFLIKQIPEAKNCTILNGCCTGISNNQYPQYIFSMLREAVGMFTLPHFNLQVQNHFCLTNTKSLYSTFEYNCLANLHSWGAHCAADNIDIWAWTTVTCHEIHFKYNRLQLFTETQETFLNGHKQSQTAWLR